MQQQEGCGSKSEVSLGSPLSALTTDAAIWPYVQASLPKDKLQKLSPFCQAADPFSVQPFPSRAPKATFGQQSSVEAGMLALTAEPRRSSENLTLLAGMSFLPGLDSMASMGNSFAALFQFGSLLAEGEGVGVNPAPALGPAPSPPTRAVCEALPPVREEVQTLEQPRLDPSHSDVPPLKMRRQMPPTTAPEPDSQLAEAQVEAASADEFDNELTYQQELDRLLQSGRKLNRAEKTRLRREKNKIAARKCRQRKQDTFLETDTKLKQLQAESDSLRANATQTLVLVRKYVSLYAALESSCANNEAEGAPLRAIIAECCSEAKLTQQDMVQSCALTGMHVEDGLLPTTAAPTAEREPAAVAEAWNYINAHGRSLDYVVATAIVSGPTVTTGHNPVPEKS